LENVFLSNSSKTERHFSVKSWGASLIIFIQSTSTAIRTWSAFVPLCRRRFKRYSDSCKHGIFHICTVSVQISRK